MDNEAAELSTEEWKQRKKEKKAQMAAMRSESQASRVAGTRVCREAVL